MKIFVLPLVLSAESLEALPKDDSVRYSKYRVMGWQKSIFFVPVTKGRPLLRFLHYGD